MNDNAEKTSTFMNVQGGSFVKGYSTGVVDPDEHCDAPHDAGPLPLELMWLSQMAVEAGIQQADNSCEKEQTNPNYTR